MHAAVGELWEVVFSVGSAHRLSGEPKPTKSHARVEAIRTPTIALRVVGGDEKGTQCLGVQLDHPVLEGYKCGDLALEGGGVSNLRQFKNDCAGVGQQQL
jgi:hypothetical protein